MKPVGLKSVKVGVPKSSVRLEGQPCSLGQSRRKVKLMDERSYTLSVGNGDYFWTNKDTLWNYVQTLSGKKSLSYLQNECFKNCSLEITWKVHKDKENKISNPIEVGFFSLKFYVEVKEYR